MCETQAEVAGSLSLSLSLVAPDSSSSCLRRCLSYKKHAPRPRPDPLFLSCAALEHEPGVLQEHARTRKASQLRKLSKLRSQCPTLRWRSTRPTKSKAMDSRDTKKSSRFRGAILRSRHSESPRICTNSSNCDEGLLDSRRKNLAESLDWRTRQCHLQSRTLLIPRTLDIKPWQPYADC